GVVVGGGRCDRRGRCGGGGGVVRHGRSRRGRQPSAPAGGVTADVLRVDGLSVRYHTPGGAVRAADDLTFSLRRGERLGIAGESGSGKSTLALSLLRPIKPPRQIEAGQI